MIAEIECRAHRKQENAGTNRGTYTDYYSKAIDYLNGVVGDQPLIALDNPEARNLITRMKVETKRDGSKRFGDAGKTIVEYFRVF